MDGTIRYNIKVKYQNAFVENNIFALISIQMKFAPTVKNNKKHYWFIYGSN